MFSNKSHYYNCCAILTTKHSKSLAIARPFWNRLGMEILEYHLDTDHLGTFSGETTRYGDALECVRRKCEMGLELVGKDVEYGLANEGSFGPHPYIFFVPCDQEILYFIDRKRDFHLHLTHISEKTNYQMESLDSLEELQKFAESSQFPSHALIIRPNDKKDYNLIFKGITKDSDLIEAFKESKKYSSDGKAWVETDMRAQYNPSRMEVISELADKMAQRLATLCPKCNMPGWGKINIIKGLKCSQCSSNTELVKYEIFGCVKCNYSENKSRTDGLINADPKYCPYCNP